MRSAFMPRNMKPRRSKRATTSPTRPRATPLGLTMTNVRSMGVPPGDSQRRRSAADRAVWTSGRSGAIVDRHRGHGAVDVGLAVRTHPPVRFDGLAARGAGGAQPAAAGGAHEVVVAHRRLAERAARLLAQALLHHLHLELLLTTVGDEFRRPDDGVDDEAQRPEDDAGEHANLEDDLVVHAPAGVLEDPVGAGDPCLLYTSPSPRDRTRARMPS